MSSFSGGGYEFCNANASNLFSDDRHCTFKTETALPKFFFDVYVTVTGANGITKGFVSFPSFDRNFQQFFKPIYKWFKIFGSRK